MKRILLLLTLLTINCAQVPENSGPQPTPTVQTAVSTPTETVAKVEPTPAQQTATSPSSADVQVRIDTTRAVHPISPLIYGLSGASPDHVARLQPTLTSWGGNPSTRFNWEIGHAWNAARDWEYRNGNYGSPEGSVSDAFIEDAMANNMAIRLAIPTLGWVARDDNNESCSFPQADGSCGYANNADCNNPTQIADPTLTSVPSTPESIQAWVRHLIEEQGYEIDFISMDNEPELWGHTHYDVHPDCTTYAEVLEKYLTYATAVRDLAPDAELTGPTTCCWYFYWNSAAGDADKAAHGNQDFLPWFLDNVRQHDENNGVRTLDVLDVHFYPEGLYNNESDPTTAAHRLRSTRSLWDASYVDESWINEPIYLIPRLKELVATHYPGTRLALSEWNWGADESMNGALAIADVLGIFGREDLYFAAYWRQPPVDSPGFYAFQMYTNFDGQGGRFGDTSVLAQSTNDDRVSSYAALDSETGELHIMLVNKELADSVTVELDLSGFSPQAAGSVYQYMASQEGVVETAVSEAAANFKTTLPSYSITLLVLAAQ